MTNVSTDHDPNRRLTRRERLAIRMLLLAIWLLAPWRWDHLAREYFEDIKRELHGCTDD